MDNIFKNYPEFIDSDPRRLRDNTATAYNIDANFQYLRHQACLPADIVKGKRVLDLGSCVGASGAWVLSLGAEKYVGVELQEKFYQQSVENLTKHFDHGRWQVHQQSVVDFLKANVEHYDIVIMFGILYQGIYFEELLLNVLKTTPEHVLIDSIEPFVFLEAVAKEKIKNLPLIEYVENQAMVSENTGNNHIFNAARVSVEALKVIFWSNGYSLDKDHTEYIRSLRPGPYQNRYCLDFAQSGPDNLVDFANNYKSTNNKVEILLGSNTRRNQWTFNTAVSENFVDHARQHIPKYDEIINQSVQICAYTFGIRPDVKILDVGCATGETVQRLYAAGFQNLFGVDASQAMLDRAQQLPIATWICDTDFPADQGPYDAVLCNWTLHFIQEKQKYLEKIYNSLSNDGIFIVSDKTANSGIELDLYHEFKRASGVSEEDIKLKAESIKDIMFVDPPEWYIDVLRKIGFSNVKIINASPCFTTFMATKR